jgi:hypothetical protein
MTRASLLNGMGSSCGELDTLKTSLWKRWLDDLVSMRSDQRGVVPVLVVEAGDSRSRAGGFGLMPSWKDGTRA